MERIYIRSTGSKITAATSHSSATHSPRSTIQSQKPNPRPLKRNKNVYPIKHYRYRLGNISLPSRNQNCPPRPRPRPSPPPTYTLRTTPPAHPIHRPLPSSCTFSSERPLYYCTPNMPRVPRQSHQNDIPLPPLNVLEVRVRDMVYRGHKGERCPEGF